MGVEQEERPFSGRIIDIIQLLRTSAISFKNKGVNWRIQRSLQSS